VNHWFVISHEKVMKFASRENLPVIVVCNLKMSVSVYKAVNVCKALFHMVRSDCLD